MFNSSSKTMVLGILAVLGAVISAITGVINNTPVDWTATVSAIMAGIGLIFAKDYNATGGVK